MSRLRIEHHANTDGDGGYTVFETIKTAEEKRADFELAHRIYLLQRNAPIDLTLPRELQQLIGHIHEIYQTER
jgi:hypothetical protein